MDHLQMAARLAEEAVAPHPSILMGLSPLSTSPDMSRELLEAAKPS